MKYTNKILCNSCFSLLILLFFVSINCDNWQPSPDQIIVPEKEIITLDNVIMNEITVPPNTNIIYLEDIANNFIMAGTKKGDIYFSSDKGKNWKFSKSLGYPINCIKGYTRGIIAGTDNGLYLFNKSGEFANAIIQPNDTLERAIKIKDFIISGPSIYDKYSCNAYGYDGENNIFTCSVENTTSIKRQICKMANSKTTYEFLYSDSRIDNYNEIEVYLNRANDTCMYAFLVNNAYQKTVKFDKKVTAVALNRTIGSSYFLGTTVGLLKFLYTNSSDYIHYFAGHKIKSILSSSLGVIYTVTDENAYYSLNEGSQWIKMYFNEDNPEIIKFYEQENSIYALGTNGKIYYFYDLASNYYRQTPLIVSPDKNEIVDANPKLKWYAVKYKDSTDYGFQVQLSKSENFDNPVINVKEHFKNEYQLNNLESGKKYYWRVRKNNGEYNYMWAVSEFTVK